MGSDQFINISLTDNGTGMTDEQKEKCFDPFYTTKGTEGTGLGLAEVFGMVNRHEGTLEIESELGVGTTFHIKIPVHDILKESIDKSESAESFSFLRILFVDDNIKIRDAFAELLEIDGYSVTVCSEGLSAIEVYQKTKEDKKDFDLVITDLGMPGMDGLELSRRIKEIDRNIPIILLSGWGKMLDRDKELTEDIDYLLSKPPNMKELRKAIAELIPEKED
ncbi:MAG: response regulator [Spirochaetales bacterium]|nr:response regulator [Spirochaetales bacterium]